MPCIACGDWEGCLLCDPCRGSLRRRSLRWASPRTLPSGLRVVSAYDHDGCARVLVHRLKYQGMEAAVRLLAPAMAVLLDGTVEALVPVPRVRLRRLRYGLDQAEELARAIGALAGVPVLPILSPPVWSSRHAGRAAAARGRTSFRARASPDVGITLVDDVVTTGATLEAAARALPVPPLLAITATSARPVHSPPR